MYNKKELKKTERKLDKRDPFKKDMIYGPKGQWAHPGENTRVPSDNITMKNVPYPVWAQPNVGPGVMMMPDQEYNFPGADYVDEFPQGFHRMPDGSMMANEAHMQDGGSFNQAAYSDSLNLYKAYQFQKSNMPKAYDAWLKDTETWSDKGAEYFRKSRAENIGRVGHTRSRPSGPSGYDADFSKYDSSTKEEQPIINYYKNLKFNEPIRIGDYGSPDLFHKNIKPSHEYWDGIGYNPVYKKPMSQEEWEATQGPPSLPTRPLTQIPTNEPERKLIQMPKEDMTGKVKPPASVKQWVQNPQTGTWSQIERPMHPSQLEARKIGFMQDGGENVINSIYDPRYKEYQGLAKRQKALEEYKKWHNEVTEAAPSSYDEYMNLMNKSDSLKYASDVLPMLPESEQVPLWTDPKSGTTINKKRDMTPVENPYTIDIPATPWTTDQTQGDAFRQWVNETYPEQAATWDLDPTGGPDNNYIRSAYQELGADYEASKIAQETPVIEAPPQQAPQITAPPASDVVMPGSNSQWVQTPNGTWHQIQRPAVGATYDISTGGYSQMQNGGYVDMELSDQEIASLRSQGYRVDDL